MDSKTAKAVDRALAKFEKQCEKLQMVVYDLRNSIKKHFPKPEKKANGAS